MLQTISPSSMRSINSSEPTACRGHVNTLLGFLNMLTDSLLFSTHISCIIPKFMTPGKLKASTQRYMTVSELTNKIPGITSSKKPEVSFGYKSLNTNLI